MSTTTKGALRALGLAHKEAMRAASLLGSLSGRMRNRDVVDAMRDFAGVEEDSAAAIAGLLAARGGSPPMGSPMAVLTAGARAIALRFRSDKLLMESARAAGEQQIRTLGDAVVHANQAGDPDAAAHLAVIQGRVIERCRWLHDRIRNSA